MTKRPEDDIEPRKDMLHYVGLKKKQVTGLHFDEFALPPMTPEQNLLGAILKQAILDHTMPLCEVEQDDRRTARIYFRGKRNDRRYGTFAYCCHGISNDPDALMDKVLEFVRRKRKQVGLPDDV